MATEAPQPETAVELNPGERNPAVILLRERFPDLHVLPGSMRGQDWVTVPAEAVIDVLRLLRDEPGMAFALLTDVTAVDLLPRHPRWEVVYSLLSLQHNRRFRVKVDVPDGPEPEVPTATTLWPAANFFEREVYDLLGIRFAGHPNMTRIMLPDDWQGYPLRYDHPLGGEEVGFTS